MQDFRITAFWLNLALCACCLLMWPLTSTVTVLLVYIAGLLAYLVTHMYWIHRLNAWLAKPSLNSIPEGQGVWTEIFSSLYHEQRKHSRSQSQLSNTLDRFLHAASALPDGVVILNNEYNIEWFNTPSEMLMGLKKSHDENKPVTYLVRQHEFMQYLSNGDFSEPLKLKSAIHQGITLEYILIPFGTEQKLLICRDISTLEQTELMRRDFIANVSHELRTPLTVIGGFLETIHDMDGAVSEEVGPYFDMMEQQTVRMRHIIEDLLMLSQIENNNKLTDENEIDMQRMLQTLTTDAISLSNNQHQINSETDPDLNIKGSHKELLSAFSNLISNAVRYTPDQGMIFISWKLRNNQAVFSVKDTGIGIDAQHIPRLTERFYRVDSSRSRETGGTGLGLSIVKHILNHHQASLEIESKTNQGSEFRIVFPAARTIVKNAR